MKHTNIEAMQDRKAEPLDFWSCFVLDETSETQSPLSGLSEEARQLGNMGKVLCSKQAFPGWLSRWQDKKLMKNENVL